MSGKYALSMSGSTARVQECLIAARTYLELGDWNAVRKSIVEDNLFQLNAPSSRKRVASEIVKRLRTLTDDEAEFLASAVGDDRHAMIWVSICRTYQFVRDFSQQVLAERYDHSMPTLPRAAYDVFFEEQEAIHPELARMTKLGRDKMRTVVFKMLHECRLLDDEGTITPLHPTPAFAAALGDKGVEDLASFPGVTA
ncbi:MAG: DUF1819 family protein [Atopobiaceae bacterium]|nr:DUF1819 family protein [Atopobiaceae bacterium]